VSNEVKQARKKSLKRRQLPITNELNGGRYVCHLWVQVLEAMHMN
jgi:hypothetical protein